MIANLMAQIGNHTNAKVEENMVRHMVLNSIRSLKNKFSNEYGELVIACDHKNCWRKDIFPYYKANRKKTRKESELNWNEIFECLNKIRQELNDFFPYRVLHVETAEADDIIATLVFNHGIEGFNTGEKILILSGDKDFIQLHNYHNVDQYDPVKKKFVTHHAPTSFLKEHILRGDVGDGIPNFLSNDNCFVVGERQKSLTQKKIDYYLNTEPELFESEMLKRNYNRNSILIDLRNIPQQLRDIIMNEYENNANKPTNQIFNYFVKHRLKTLMENINDF
jgi:hypothetical protein